MRPLPWLLSFAFAASSCGSAPPPAPAAPPQDAAEAAGPRGQELLLPRRPALSPDGSQVAFGHQGDLWVADTATGTARRLTGHDAYDGAPRWSPDGKWLAFLSTRHGNSDVFVIPAAGGTPDRITWNSENEALHGWIDQDRILIGATRERRYSRRGQGGWVAWRDGRTPTLLVDTPMQRPAVSPDGRLVVFERGHGDPRRRGYRGSASSALWIHDLEAGTFRELTRFDGNDLQPMWSGDGRTVFFLSDRPCEGNPDGRELGLWAVPVTGGNPRPVYHPGGRSLREASISRDGSTVVAELDTGLVLIDTASGAARPLLVYGSYDPSEPAEYDVTVDGDAGELAVSPDGESIAFVAEGDIFVLRKHDKIRRCARVTTAVEPDSNPVWVEDGKALLFLSERDGNSEIYRAAPSDPETPFWRARSFRIERLTETPVDEVGLSRSPDGRLLAWVEYPGRLVVAGAEDRRIRRVVTDGFDTPDYRWSPDSRWLAFSKVDDDYNSEVYLARAVVDEDTPADAPGVKPFNVSRHPDDDASPVWSPDGRKLAFTSRRQILDETDVYLVWLRKGDAEMTEQERLEAEEAAKKAKKAKKAAEPAKGRKEEKRGQEPGDGQDEQEEKEAEEEPAVEPIRIDFADLHERVVRLTRREGNEEALGFDADSEKVFFNATLGTRLTTGTTGVETGFFAIGVYDRDEERLEPTPVSSLVRHEKEVFYVKGGQVVGRTGKATTYPFSVTFRRDGRAFRRAVAEQAWRVLDRGFYDPGFHGHDWSASLRKWLPALMAASTGEDFATFMNWMLGEMNASHMGFYGGGRSAAKDQDTTATGHLGVVWDETWSGPGRRVRLVLEDGPAWREASRLHPGDLILAVNGHELGPTDNFYRAMAGTAGKETELRVRSEAGEERTVFIRPGTLRDLSRLLYRHAVREARAKVEQASGGRLGYVHIEAMGTPSLVEFERSLYDAGAGKEVLLIDVRENGGGWTTDMILNMLMVNDHAVTVPRGGGKGYPQGRRIFATWNKPVVVLCNENSYSNAEIFSWAIKTLKRGPLVGKQTYGAVISTGAATLLDGSMVRLPMRGWYVNDGTMTNMELNGCRPDYEVENLPGDYAAGVDRQLDKAIEVGLGLADESRQ
ncbi:MAG: peptidase S41 [Planctomycetota bacterium]|nr:MAG: peptidase S41 [Planctomycetota bacterium]